MANGPRAYALANANAKSFAPKYGEATFCALALKVSKKFSEIQGYSIAHKKEISHVYARHPRKKFIKKLNCLNSFRELLEDYSVFANFRFSMFF